VAVVKGEANQGQTILPRNRATDRHATDRAPRLAAAVLL